MRKATHLERAGGKSPRQWIWEELRRKNESSIIALAAATNNETEAVRSYIRALLNGGYVEIAEANKRASYVVYRLIKNVGVDAPRLRPDGTPATNGAARDAMWRTMRILQCDFSATELAGAASTDDCVVTPETARLYVRHLCAAGYLQRVGDRAEACYVLKPSRNTGPRAPIVQKTKCVYDPNLGEIVWHEEIEE
ncbi:MAG: hypothetical protein FWC38_00445 [Proteobacteria bacterium]|nr:hypothetical protein [Pseudomonadota bacterium]MCL2306711.1 hypothetical protein [Pseudomonadota bacterium]